MSLRYYTNLDGVRAIAALMVMLLHFFSEIETPTRFLQILQKLSIFGGTGVTLFFVLSGFLITRILIHTKSDNHYFRPFFVRRILRIFPLYYFYLILFFYLTPLIVNTTRVSFENQLVYFLYLQNIAMTFHWPSMGPSHFWSLAVEEHFYLFWPFAVYFLSGKNLLRLTLFIIAFALGLRAYMVANSYEVFYFTLTRFDSLAFGALLAVLETKDFFSSKNAKKFILVFFALLVPTIILWTFISGDANSMNQIFKHLILSAIYFSVIGYVLS